MSATLAARAAQFLMTKEGVAIAAGVLLVVALSIQTGRLSIRSAELDAEKQRVAALETKLDASEKSIRLLTGAIADQNAAIEDWRAKADAAAADAVARADKIRLPARKPDIRSIAELNSCVVRGC